MAPGHPGADGKVIISHGNGANDHNLRQRLIHGTRVTLRQSGDKREPHSLHGPNMDPGVKLTARHAVTVDFPAGMTFGDFLRRCWPPGDENTGNDYLKRRGLVAGVNRPQWCKWSCGPEQTCINSGTRTVSQTEERGTGQFFKATALPTANAAGIRVFNFIFSMLWIVKRVWPIMRTLFCFALCFVLLGGCTNYKQTHLASGEVGYSIRCNLLGSGSWNGCYVMAGDICGERGYEVISKHSDSLDRSGKHLWIKCN